MTSDNVKNITSVQSITSGMKIFEIFAYDWQKLPYEFSLLIIFCVLLVLGMIFLSISEADRLAWLGFFALVLVIFLAIFVAKRRYLGLSAEARRLIRFLGLTSGRVGIRFCIPTYKNVETKDINGVSFTYSSHAETDVAAMIEIFTLLARNDLVQETRNPLKLVITEEDKVRLDVETIVNIGGPRISRYVSGLIQEDPIVSYELVGKSEEIAITIGGGLNRRYSMRPPKRQKKRTDEDTLREATYGCVMKRVMDKPSHFAIWGLDARGTLAAAHWLVREWKNLEGEYEIKNDASFTAIVRVPAGWHHAQKPIWMEHNGDEPLLLPSE
jgi:hypothetical protein